MSYYKLIRIVANRLSEWINDENRESYTSFCRKMRLQYGINRNKIDKILQEDYPTLTIEDDQLVRNE